MSMIWGFFCGVFGDKGACDAAGSAAVALLIVTTRHHTGHANNIHTHEEEIVARLLCDGTHNGSKTASPVLFTDIGRHIEEMMMLVQQLFHFSLTAHFCHIFRYSMLSRQLFGAKNVCNRQSPPRYILKIVETKKELFSLHTLNATLSK